MEKRLQQNTDLLHSVDDSADNLKPVLALYGWQGAAVSLLQDDVYKISVANKDYCLKRMRESLKKINFICNIIAYLQAQDFALIPDFVVGQNGQIIQNYDGINYTATHWITGVKCDFFNARHLVAATKTTALFHNQAHGCRINGIRDCSLNWQEQLQSRSNDFLTWYEIAQGNRHQQAAEEYLKTWRYYCKRAEAAQNLLSRSNYCDLAAEAKAKQNFVHRDIAARNFIIDYKGDACLIDFDYCRYDIPLSDLVRLIERSMRVCDFSPRKLDLIMDTYCQYGELDYKQCQVIYSLLMFPQKYWRYCQRYFNQTISREEFLQRISYVRGYQQKEKSLIEYFYDNYC